MTAIKCHIATYCPQTSAAFNRDLFFTIWFPNSETAWRLNSASNDHELIIAANKCCDLWPKECCASKTVTLGSGLTILSCIAWNSKQSLYASLFESAGDLHGKKNEWQEVASQLNLQSTQFTMWLADLLSRRLTIRLLQSNRVQCIFSWLLIRRELQANRID